MFGDYIGKVMELSYQSLSRLTGLKQLGFHRTSSVGSSIVYMSMDHFFEMYRHCADFANSQEVIGWLIGDVFSDGTTGYCRIFHSITGGNEATAVSARFSPDGIADTMRQLTDFQNKSLLCPLDQAMVSDGACCLCGYDLRRARIVGWYHSHPNLSPFMSETDMQTHETYFDFNYGVAIVIDPVQEEYRIWQTRSGSVEEVVLHGVITSTYPEKVNEYGHTG